MGVRRKAKDHWRAKACPRGRLHFSGGCLASKVPRRGYEALAPSSLSMPSNSQSWHEVYSWCECQVEVLMAPFVHNPPTKHCGMRDPTLTLLLASMLSSLSVLVLASQASRPFGVASMNRACTACLNELTLANPPISKAKLKASWCASACRATDLPSL